MVPNEAGVNQTVQTLRGAGNSQQEVSVPTRLSVRFNPGAYYIGFGTAADTCVPADNCDPTIGRCPRSALLATRREPSFVCSAKRHVAVQ